MNLAKEFTATAAAIHEHVAEVREQIAAISEEIAWYQSAPLPKLEIVERAAAAVDREATKFIAEAQVGDLVHRGEVAELLELTGRTEVVAPGSPIAGVNIKISPLLAWLFSSTIKDRLAEAIEQGEIDFAEGPPQAERTALIQSARARLHALGLEEEALIEQAEAVGIEIARRPDAAPDVILCAREVSVYRFKASPVSGEYFFGEVESDEPLTRSEITARARHALPSEWLAQFELESIEILERLDSEDIIDDGDDVLLPRATTPRSPKRGRTKQFTSKGFEADLEKAAIERDLVVADNPPRMK